MNGKSKLKTHLLKVMQFMIGLILVSSLSVVISYYNLSWAIVFEILLLLISPITIGWGLVVRDKSNLVSEKIKLFSKATIEYYSQLTVSVALSFVFFFNLFVIAALFFSLLSIKNAGIVLISQSFSYVVVFGSLKYFNGEIPSFKPSGTD